MQRCKQGLIIGALLLFGLSAKALELTPVISSNLSQPTFIASPPNDDRLFVSERGGSLKVFTNDGTYIGVFLSITGVNTSGEGGFLGFAFHPDYDTNGYIFVSYTGSPGGQFSTIIERYETSANPNVASSTTPKEILTVAQPRTNHNAGWIGFSPVDGYLYIPMGDGGGGNDTFGNGQNLSTLLGSILRLNVDAPSGVPYLIPDDNPYTTEAGLDEIWAHGVRNPWRAGFDSQTGEFYFGDVGQGAWEEVNRGEIKGNFGWPLREGFIATPGSVGGELSPRVDPLHVYPNFPTVPRSVVGGVVYRGPVLALQGKYLFAEFYTSDIWQMDLDGSNVVPLANDLGFGGTPIAFGEDTSGDVYLVDLGGTVYRFDGEQALATVRQVPVLPLGALSLLAMIFGFIVWHRRTAEN
ncbi:MAG: PQQ-dependent sugar dehydrogenase [Pseudomonadota bacterium]